ncbi:MAG: mechanosensitive ion channel family protein [Anaerolineales bacterium]|nr:mechanosensitive ion channel family protein [Anaerolineales bacterium]
MSILTDTWFGNPLSAWLLALALTIAAVALLRGLRNMMVRRLKHIAHGTVTQIDDLAISLMHSSRSWFFLAISLYIGSRALTLPEGLEDFIKLVTIFSMLLQAALWANQLIDHGLQLYARNTLEAENDPKNTVAILSLASRIILWTIILLLALDNLGIEITGLLTGLGIGGIAIALAVQNILSDLLSYVSIMLDRPFKIGDFLVVDQHMGAVEKIGLKTTRVRSLSGEMIIFANHDLLSCRLINFQDRKERRAVFTFGVTYDTSPEKVASIPTIVRDILESYEHVRFDRSHFKTFGDFSLDFETVYYVTTADYSIYMDVQQNVNLELLRRFEQEDIEFAFPTQTVHVTTQTT